VTAFDIPHPGLDGFCELGPAAVAKVDGFVPHGIVLRPVSREMQPLIIDGSYYGSHGPPHKITNILHTLKVITQTHIGNTSTT
jgi:hypothetical protein